MGSCNDWIILIVSPLEEVMSNTLAEIKSGKKTGLVVPHRTTYDPGEDRDIKTILPAVGGDELEILLLAVNQYITPKELLQVYPDVSDLRKHIVATRDHFLNDPTNQEYFSAFAT